MRKLLIKMLIRVSIWSLFKHICRLMPQMLFLFLPLADRVRIKIDPVLPQHHSPTCVCRTYI